MSGATTEAQASGSSHPTATPPSTTPTPLSSRARDAIQHRQTPYGNYKSYYTFRPASTSNSQPSQPSDNNEEEEDTLDQRLQLLDRSMFKGKNVLDLGTNAGKISMDLTNRFEPNFVLGVDIDDVLIDDAERIAKDTMGDELERGKLKFEVGDFMQKEWFDELERRTTSDDQRFQVALLFSVTKWLHLHHGDAGMMRLFESLYRYLPSGGIVVVEPQEKENYGRAVKKNKDLRPMYKTIERWPPFEVEMKEVGFELLQTIERVEGGFSRPLLIWRKP